MSRTITTTFRTLLAAGALGALVAGCGDGDDGESTATTAPVDPGGPEAPAPGPGEGDRVSIETFTYRPDPLTIPSGTTVTWDQRDNTTHTVTSGNRDDGPDGLFDASLAQGDTFSFTFDEPGSYPYYCTLHSGPGMTGEVVVR